MACCRTVWKAGAVNGICLSLSCLRQMTGLAHARLGPLEAGVETSSLSVADVNVQEGTGVEYMVPGGMAKAILDGIGGVDVELGKPVDLIDWSGDAVAISGIWGTLTARTVVITVSSGVLASGQLLERR